MKRQTTLKTVFGLILAGGLMTTGLRADLQHRYSFDSDASDSVGSADGTVVNTTGNSAFADGQLTLGNDGTQTSDGGAGDYVDFPNDILSNLVPADNMTQLTFEAWFTWSGDGGAWQRVWDFGTSQGGEDSSSSGDGTAQLFSTGNIGGGGQRAAWRPNGGGESNITAPNNAPAGEETYFAWTWDEVNGVTAFYINGSQVGAAATNISIGDDVAPFANNNWLGRSQWNDTLFAGKYNEFRISDNAMGVLDVARSFLAGPDSTTPGDLGAVTGFSVDKPSVELVLDESTSVALSADFENFAGANVTSLSTYSSDNENVATVENGVITGVGEGTATITAEYEGQMATVDVSVTIPPFPVAMMVHRYDFSASGGQQEVNGVTGDVVEDIVGDADGLAFGVTFNGDGTASFGGNDAASYVDLPNGLLSERTNVTIEAWTTFSSDGGSWQRVFDFGNSTEGERPPGLENIPSGQDGGTGPGYNGTDTLFYAPRRGGITGNNSGRYSFAPGPTAGNENPQIDPNVPGVPPVDQEFHTVAIYNYSQRVASLWIDGARIGQAPVLPDRPLSEIEDVNVWLGRSNWGGDSFMTGSYNEFRMYEGSLTPLQIAVNASTGPDTIIDDPGALTSLSLEVDADTFSIRDAPVGMSLVGDFENVQDVNLSFVPGTEFTSSDPDVVTILENPFRLLGRSPGSATITATQDTQEATVDVTVTDGGAAMPELVHRYTFDNTLADSGPGARDAVSLEANAAFDNNGGVVMNGDGWIDMDNFLFSDFVFDDSGFPLPLDQQPTVWVEIFGHWAGGGNWQRLYDFGDNNIATEDPLFPDTNTGIPDLPAPWDVRGGAYNGATSAYLAPSDGANLNAELAGTGGFGNLLAPALTPDQDFYVAVVYDPQGGTARMYRNGAFAAVSTLPANDSPLGVNDVNAWLGRSNWGADPLYNGTITEFRMGTGFLTADDVAKHAACGPDELDCEPPTEAPVIDSITLNGDGTVTVAWTGGGTLQMTPTLPASNWQDVSDQSPQTISAAEGNAYLRVAR